MGLLAAVRIGIMLSVALLIVSCAKQPIVDDRYAPEHVVVQHTVVFGESPETIAAAESAANKACQRHGRVVELPASDNFCITRHWYFGNCMVHRYTFDCMQ